MHSSRWLIDRIRPGDTLLNLVNRADMRVVLPSFCRRAALHRRWLNKELLRAITREIHGERKRLYFGY
jgi:hypothetical protein